MSRPTRTLAAVAVVAALATTATTATACDGDGKADPTPTPTTSRAVTSTSPTPTTTPSPTSTKTPDEVGAEQAVVAFWAKLDEKASDPYTSLTDLSAVARDQARLQWQRNLTVRRGKGWKQIGSTIVRSPDASYSKKDVWDVSTCIDVTKVNIVDKDGKSVVAANRLPRVQSVYEVTKDNGKFYVTRDAQRKVRPC
ncbi:hypothetical protein [Actinopolymorpha pittospori]|uniref:Lipoprotein n=1 Tax=Actinopolymorpha pittospori TaxID=648752 RepID=A0A927N6V9_9ACTN|nr:hypothetical protein [Actinopolymorpha pittospori]MBE1610062.1 hypothetical protein [Actinopolymorpha pittospori]